jgi:hypothetical protein
MISCPNCQHTEIAGAIFCSKCGAQLTQVVDPNQIYTSDIKTSTIEAVEGVAIPAFPIPPVDITDSRAALHILTTGDVIYLTGGKEFTIGRSTSGQTIVPDIDLSPFQAYEAGVSRLHTNISLTPNQITVKDLGSANGTRLNGKKIDPHAEHSLIHGDILTLGRLKIQVLIKE